MHHDRQYTNRIETATPIPPSELQQFEKEFGFSYKQGVGEIIYAMVTCRQDVSYPVTKLSQYSTKPARIHVEAVRTLYQYLKDTKMKVFIIGGRPQDQIIRMNILRLN